MDELIREEIDSLYETAFLLAKQGGTALKEWWGKISLIRNKGNPSDLVTEADGESERRILKVLRQRCPTHAVLAEESGSSAGTDSRFLWVIDPLDGTTNYAHGYPVVSVSIALLYNGRPIIGFVYNPIMEEMFSAVRGRGAQFNGNAIKVSSAATLDHCLLASGFPYDRNDTKDNNFPEFKRLTLKTQGVRRGGSAALDLAYVAAGILDGYWERGIQAWDIAAGVLLVEEAGGAVTGYLGEKCDLFARKVVATNGKIHQLLIDELR